MWRERDRFPLGTLGGEVRVSVEAPSRAGIRPFGLRSVTYASGSPVRPVAVMAWCPQRQIGLIEGRPSFESAAAPSMTKYDTDGKDVLVVDYVEDD